MRNLTNQIKVHIKLETLSNENRMRLDGEQLGADVNGKDVFNKSEKVEAKENPTLKNVKE